MSNYDQIQIYLINNIHYSKLHLQRHKRNDLRFDFRVILLFLMPTLSRGVHHISGIATQNIGIINAATAQIFNCNISNNKITWYNSDYMSQFNESGSQYKYTAILSP